MRMNVDTGSMHASAGDFQRLAREIQETIGQLNQSAQQVTHSWSGSSQSSFSSLWHRLHGSLTDLNTAMGQVGKRLDEASTQYAETDRNIIHNR